MRTWVVLFAVALAVACKSSDKKEGQASPAAEPAGKPVAEAPPAPAPVVTPIGKPLRIAEGDVGDRSFEVTMPDGFKSSIGDDGETTPILVLTGPDFDLWFQSPLGRGDSDETDTLDGAAALVSQNGGKVERAEKRPDGYVLVTTGSGGRKYEVKVTRSALDVVCTAEGVDSRAEADAAVALCETLRP
jgi:cytoskeletal protein RodZ